VHLGPKLCHPPGRMMLLRLRQRDPRLDASSSTADAGAACWSAAKWTTTPAGGHFAVHGLRPQAVSRRAAAGWAWRAPGIRRV